jgi:hypothetical protein
MLTKQAHVVKRWLENNPLKLKYWINASDPNNRAMQEHLLKDVIYTSWNNNWFQVEKNLIQWNVSWLQKFILGEDIFFQNGYFPENITIKEKNTE